ncbi:MAG: aromatic ring-hydroxylating dioxygenase subunit alpha [Parafilimonas sp.]
MPSFFIDADIAKAKTIDTDFYTQQKFYDEAKEKIFASSWQFVGDVNKVPEAGDAYPFTMLENYLNEPLVLTRNNKNEINCLSNVCTHRGNLVVHQRCKQNNLKCSYHGRQFSLDGKFISMPEFKEVENFPSKNDDLHKLLLKQWGKLLFTSLSAINNFDDFFVEIIQRIKWFPINDLEFKPEFSKDYYLHANWALYCENYLEGFHIPFVHAGLSQVLDFGEYTTEIFKYSNLQLGVGKKGDVCFDLPQNSPDYGKQIAAYYFWVFPNMMFNFYPWGLSINIVEPLETDKCKVRFLTYVSYESKFEQGAGSGLNTVELEDEEVVQNVQKGIRSRFYKHGRYSVKREQGTHHFHSLIAKFMQ